MTLGNIAYFYIENQWKQSYISRGCISPDLTKWKRLIQQLGPDLVLPACIDPECTEKSPHRICSKRLGQGYGRTLVFWIRQDTYKVFGDSGEFPSFKVQFEAVREKQDVFELSSRLKVHDPPAVPNVPVIPLILDKPSCRKKPMRIREMRVGYGYHVDTTDRTDRTDHMRTDHMRTDRGQVRTDRITVERITVEKSIEGHCKCCKCLPSVKSEDKRPWDFEDSGMTFGMKGVSATGGATGGATMGTSTGTSTKTVVKEEVIVKEEWDNVFDWGAETVKKEFSFEKVDTLLDWIDEEMVW